MHDRLIDRLLEHASARPDQPCVQTFSRRSRPQLRTLAQVAEAAAAAASFYQQHGLRAGDVVVLIGTHHIDFYAAWLGCVWLGAIPTVLAEPSVRVAKEIYWSRLSELLTRIEAWGLAADPKLRLDGKLLSVPHLFAYDQVAAGAGPVPPHHQASGASTMLLQHSSGTTGLHKGVMLSHGAVWAHAQSYNANLRMGANDVVATWLPLYHDMGFIACFIMPLLYGTPVVWLSPFEWVANPALLLEATAQHRATLAWLPNFAFSFMAQRIAADVGPHDLSSLRSLINCSEPVSPDSMQKFAQRFEPQGFSPAALQTCYAMAENVFAVTTSDEQCLPRYRWLERAAWHREHRSESVAADTLGAVVHVSSGKRVADCELKILDDQRRELPPLHAGEVLIRSPFLFDGYFRRDDLNAELFDADGFYATGDVGYLDEEGQLFVTGRMKDLVIIGGKNVYPQDIEQSVNELPGVHRGRVVSFGVPMPALGTEGLVVLVESEEPPESWPQIEHQIRAAVPMRLDIDLADARVVERGQLRKSTSGKLARAGNRQWYLSGKFGTIPPTMSPDE